MERVNGEVMLTDERAKKLLASANSYELEYRISIQEIDDPYFQGMTDMELLKEEADYLLGMYDEGGTVFSDELEEARHILRRTKNGKIIPMENFAPIKRYNPRAVEWAKTVVNEYRRLKSLCNKLSKA